jgi:hypothetical protein
MIVSVGREESSGNLAALRALRGDVVGARWQSAMATGYSDVREERIAELQALLLSIDTAIAESESRTEKFSFGAEWDFLVDER